MHTEVGTLDRLHDIARLFDAYRVFYEQASDLAAATAFVRERLIRGDSHFICAMDEQHRAIGFTQIYPSFSSVSMAPIWILNDLYVDAGARRRGVGRLLLAAAQQLARETGAIRLELATQKTNKTAQSLYESSGWIREEKFFRYQLAVVG